MAADVEHQPGHGHGRHPLAERRAVPGEVQVRHAIMPGQVRFAVLFCEQYGHCVEEIVLGRSGEQPGDPPPEAG